MPTSLTAIVLSRRPGDIMRRLIFATLLLGLATAPAAFAAAPFPEDAGMLNVRTFGAHGNGRDDDTQAFLRALAASGDDTGTRFWQDRIVYVPNGTYVISAPLLKRYASGGYASGLILLGESRDHTILRLPDHAPGYGDPARPQAVVFTTSKLHDGTATSGGKDYNGLGEGNDAYMNFIENMTIDVGTGNPGAIAIDYLGNNLGAVRNVTLKAPPGSGAVGLSMIRKWPGPVIVRDVTVSGFDVGISTAQTEYGLTFEHIRLEGQRTAALKNDQNALAIRDLDLSSPGAAIVNSGAKGFLAIEGGRASAADPAALIRNEGQVTLRDFTLAGGPVSGVLQGNGWQSIPAAGWRPALEDPPAESAIPPTQWASPTRFGAADGADATDALRQAMASGASVIYLPHGTYFIHDAIDIPPTVRRIVGMNSTVRVAAVRLPAFSRTSGMFRVATDGPPLSIERMTFDNDNQGQQLGLEHSGPRDLTVRDVVSAGVTLIDRKAGGGRLFLEDVCCGQMLLAGNQPVSARQFDTEGGNVRITNRGSPLAILGLKTEGICTIVDNQAGARTDIFGGLFYMVRDPGDRDVPAFRNAGAWLSAALVEESVRAVSRYKTYVERGEDRQRETVENFPERGFGRFMPILQDGPGQAAGQ